MSIEYQVQEEEIINPNYEREEEYIIKPDGHAELMDKWWTTTLGLSMGYSCPHLTTALGQLAPGSQSLELQPAHMTTGSTTVFNLFY